MTKKQGKGPFDLLLEEITRTSQSSIYNDKTQTGQISQLNFSGLLKSNNKRKDSRIKTTGFVVIYDGKTSKTLARGVLRNISLTGFGIESYPIDLNSKDKVYVEISGGGEILGKFQCHVSWVATLDDHPQKHKMIGFDIASNSLEFKQRFQKFVNSLKSPKGKTG